MKISLEEFAKKYDVNQVEEKELKEFLGLNKAKVWKPEEGERIHFINENGKVKVKEFNSATCKSLYALGNCFKTKEEAEFMVKKLEVITELKRFAEEHNENELEWYNLGQSKYSIVYDHEEDTITATSTQHYQRNDIYFDSGDIAFDAIESIGEKRIKKYYLEIKD